MNLRPYGPVHVPSRAELVTQRNEAIAALRKILPMCPPCEERTMAELMLSVLDEMDAWRRVERCVQAAGRIA